MIKLATGLVATLVALVLSLLISSANSDRVTVENEYKVALADVVQLDRYLAAYGPAVGGRARAAARCVCRRFSAGAGPTRTSACATRP